MKLTRFRVQNYKKIEDTGWVTCKDLTVLVGKNEAGKSAIFRGLSKLNPSDGEKYDGLKEFPRSKYSAEFKQKDWIVSSVEFELTKDESKELAGICTLLKDVLYVTCSRYYSNRLEIQFKTNLEAKSSSIKTFLQSIQKWKKQTEVMTAPEGKGEQLAQIKTGLVSFLQTKTEQLSKNDTSINVPDEIVNEVYQKFSSNINESWEKDLFQNISEENETYRSEIEAKQQMKDAEKWIMKNLPQLIYFDRYDMIDSAIHIGNFIRRLKEEPDNPRLRTSKCLFEHVGLELDTIEKLDPNKPDQLEEKMRRMADERAINMSSASASMTQKFSDWWEQRKHKFRYTIDGPYFRVWVSDDLDPSEIELDQRSAGMQYFFSFYLVFLVEAEKAHQNSILLLDEPGIHYHGTAQMKTVEFLRKLSEKNQLLYTTHSPFMIDGDHLEDIKVVYEDKKTGYAKVSDNVWPEDKESIFPLQAALGYTIAQTLFQAKKQLVVEGLTDYSILKAMNELLSKRNMTSLRKDIIITPAGGIRHLMPLASILMGNKVKMAILLDADQPAIGKQKEMKEKLLIDCLLLNAITDSQKIEIEDLFPEKLYLNAVKQEYKDITLDFTEEESRILGISKRVQALFNRKGKSFDKWVPSNVLVEWIQMDQKGDDQIPDQTCKYFELIFDEVNKRL